MKEFKVGDWVFDEQTNETFLILKLGDESFDTDEGAGEIDAYIDIYYAPHITYHCIKAKQKNIEIVCLQMLELEFK